MKQMIVGLHKRERIVVPVVNAPESADGKGRY